MSLPTKLYHYSEKLLKELRQDYHDLARSRMNYFHKPFGLWLSVEDYEDDENWKTWCEKEEFALEGLKYKYLIELKKRAKILHLSTTRELEEFSLKYKGNDPFNYERFASQFTKNPYIYIIDWELLSKECDGIIIAPYNWDCRLRNPTSWYYGWDCASGCIWNIDAIKSITLLKGEFPQVETLKDLQLADLAPSK